VSLKGVTGAANLDIQGVAKKVEQIRAHTDLPIGVGFGIKDAATAASVGGVADAVVVGSALVKKFEEFADKPDMIQKEVVTILSSMRAALDANTNKAATAK
ncbi:MAG: tryptophan synthase subunit alpha, partial [Gammaproteobacteria bacterium]|nr:tryptophan synthase subunit alpha [Gammaproteobacteria bacterium]